MDISNGEGIGVSLFVQGCNFRCPSCFNKETWSFEGGKEWNQSIEDKFIELCKREHITHSSILGGEPLQQDEDLFKLVIRLKKEVSKPILLWTGYIYNNIPQNQREILKYIDILIDGQFIETLLDVNYHLAGSTNQRVIDVQKSLIQNKIILY